MENSESQKLEISRAVGRPRGVTSKDIMDRAARIRKHLRNGLHRREICARENLTLAEFRSGMNWLGRFGSDNTEAFAGFLAAQQSNLEEINKLIDDQLASGAPDVHAYVKLKRLAVEVYAGIYDMALKLGVLQRETIKIEARSVEVSFGDEGIVPWFAAKEPDKTS